MRGRIKRLTYDEGGEYELILAVSTNAIAEIEQLLDEAIEVKISKYHEMRTLSANNYLWLLCGKIADKLIDTDIKMNAVEVYRTEIKSAGTYQDFEERTPDEVTELQRAWSGLGVGWVTEIVDYSQDGERMTVRCYYGSSTYDSKQMSRLINAVVADAEALGIETLTPNEIADMISLWATAPKGKNGEQNA